MNSQSANRRVPALLLILLWAPVVALCLTWCGFLWTSLKADEIYEQHAIGAVIFPDVFVVLALCVIFGLPALLIAGFEAIRGTLRVAMAGRCASIANWTTLIVGGLMSLIWGLYLIQGPSAPVFGWALARFAVAVALVAAMVGARLLLWRTVEGSSN